MLAGKVVNSCLKSFSLFNSHAGGWSLWKTERKINFLVNYMAEFETKIFEKILALNILNG